LVTGGAGFIGSHVARRFLEDGARVTVVDDLSTGRRDNVPRGADFIQADLSDAASAGRWRALDCDAVAHLAGQSSGELSFRDPWKDFNSHVTSTFSLLDWCRAKKIRRFLYASSMAVYGDPTSFPVDENAPLRPKTYYAAAKVSAEAYIRLHDHLDMDTTIFRLFSVYGPGQDLGNKAQGMASIYLSYALEGVPIVVKGAPERFRDFTYVEDVVEAWTRAMESPATFGRTYNVASGRRVTVSALLEEVRRAVERPTHPVEFRTGTPGDQFGMEGDGGALRRDLGWIPRVPLSDGLKRMVAFERGQKDRR
jgi:UDP-glucose 4-epimerase